ncbi:MAG: type II secretion system protein M [Azoarcus sp.]|jgi:MSHA biogenesis protein MshJ|nr:type II secretion system protein M [Azoarcus sp.]
MKSLWLKVTGRYSAMKQRERWMVAGTLLAVIVFIGFVLFIDPALRRGLAAERNMLSTRTQLAEIRDQITALNSPGRHPDIAAQSELDSLQRQIEELTGRLRVLERALVPPSKMPALLEEMIGTKSGLRLISLKTLPPVPLSIKETGEKAMNSTATDEGKATGLYRHGVEVRLEGSYHDLVAYLERLEKSPLKILWGSATLSSERHPKLVLALTVYSLSMDRTWLIV